MAKRREECQNPTQSSNVKCIGRGGEGVGILRHRFHVLILVAVTSVTAGLMVTQSASAHRDRTCSAQTSGPAYVQDGKIRGHGVGECEPNHKVVCQLTWIQVQNFQGKWITPDDQDWNEVCVPRENHVGDFGSFAGCGFGSGTLSGIYRVKTRFRALNKDGVIVHKKRDTSNGRVLSC